MFAIKKNLVFYWLIEKLSLEGAAYVAAFLFGVVLCIAIPYLLGSLNASIIISKLFYHDDIRKYGSGNAGTTNMLRTYGKKPAALTLLFDMLKGALSMVFGILVFGNVAFGSIAGLFAVIGHMFPCFSHFKGGKGVATSAAVILVTNPIVFLILVTAFVIIVVGTKMISLGSVMCVLLYPLILFNFSVYKTWDVIVSFIIMGLVVFMHRENIMRIFHGQESKLDFGRLFGKKKEEKLIEEPAEEESPEESEEEYEEEIAETPAAPARKKPQAISNAKKKRLKKQRDDERRRSAKH